MKPVFAVALASCWVTLLSVLLPGLAVAGDTAYEYDALGRLTEVIRDGIVVEEYAYDKAGNRSQSKAKGAQTLSPGVPASISVPSSSSTGSYTISWGIATGTITAYQLYEAANASFAGQVQVYSGTGTSTGLSGRADGTYYYRVQACNGAACSAYRTGSNGTTVTVAAAPSVPPTISVPSSSDTGSYTISWGSASGTVTAYQLYEATNASFSGQVQVYSGTGTSKWLSGRADGTYYYRVQACNSAACSGYRTGSNGTTVTLPPGVPASISVPSSSSTGSYTISWGTSSGIVTAYQLYEATNASFSGQVQVYSGTGTSSALSGRSEGTYYYRVQACNGAACSGYRTGSNGTMVTLPPSVPSWISVPSSNNTGNYTISWGASSGTVTTYQLYEATNKSFSGQVQVYSGIGTSAWLSGRADGIYYYGVRACNGAACSDYRTGSNGITVAVPVIATISPTSVNFGVRRINTSSVYYFSVTNEGAAPLIVSSIALSGANPGQFAVPSYLCAYPVPPQDSCSGSVTFTPTSIGTKTATLTVSSNASNGPVTATLSGIGKVHITRFDATPSSVPIGGTIDLLWRSSGALSCEGSGDLKPSGLGWNKPKDTNGSMNFIPVNLPGTHLLTLTCTDAQGRTDARSVSYTVTLL